MFLILRNVLVALLVSGLTVFPVMAAGARPLGMVVTAENAHVSGAVASVGSDVFTGEVLQTDPGGNLRLKFGMTQIYLNSGSNATLGQEANPLRVVLTQGTLDSHPPLARNSKWKLRSASCAPPMASAHSER